MTERAPYSAPAAAATESEPIAVPSQVDAPPPFSLHPGFEDQTDKDVHDDPLPEYESSKAQTRTRRNNNVVERVFTLDTSKRKPWAFLKVNTRAGSTSQSAPNFFEGDLITGMVELELEKSDSFVAIILEVRGESLAIGQEPVSFYSESITLWSLNSTQPQSQPGPASSKFKGHYVWPYSVKLPDKVAMPSTPKASAMSEYPLPPSFTERASPAYLEYKIVVTLKRGFLRPNSTLVTLFAYLPRITPPVYSSFRQLAYQENSLPPPPNVDPEGWHDLGSRTATGIIFETRQVDVSSLFFLAKPLSYTRGTFVPFSLTLSCLDTQALDLFTARGSLDIKLKRTLRVGSTAVQGKTLNDQRTDTAFETTAGEGVYWAAEGNVPDSETRRLEGEILLKPDLKPSFVFPNVTVKYTVQFALVIPGFVILSNNGVAPVYEQEIEIATLMGPGPAPRSRSAKVIPTGNGNGEGQSSGNYDVSIGVLTQANQRFIHLGHHGLS